MFRIFQNFQFFQTLKKQVQLNWLEIGSSCLNNCRIWCVHTLTAANPRKRGFLSLPTDFFFRPFCETAQSENYFALLSLLTPSAYSECGWGIPHIPPWPWISLTGVAWTHQRNTSEVCVHAHSLSAESEAVSFEYDNRAWKTVPVSGHLLKTEACLLKQARACSTVQPVEQDSKQS